MLSRRRNKLKASLATSYWQQHVRDSIASRLSLQATLHLDSEETARQDETRFIVVVWLTGSQTLKKKTWDVLRDMDEFRQFEKQLVEAGLAIPKLEPSAHVGPRLLRRVGRWLDEVLVAWQREDRRGNFMVFRKRPSPEKVNNIARVMESFFFLDKSNNSFETIFRGDSTCGFGSATARVRTLRHSNRRDTDLLLACRKLEMVDSEWEDRAIQSKLAKPVMVSATPVQSFKEDSILWMENKLNSWGNKGQPAQEPYPQEEHMIKKTKSMKTSGVKSRRGSVSKSRYVSRIRRYSSVDVYPTPAASITAKHRSPCKPPGTELRTDSETVDTSLLDCQQDPLTPHGSPTEHAMLCGVGQGTHHHCRHESGCSTFSVGSELFHLRFSAQAQTQQDEFNFEFEDDDMGSYYDDEFDEYNEFDDFDECGYDEELEFYNGSFVCEGGDDDILGEDEEVAAITRGITKSMCRCVRFGRTIEYETCIPQDKSLPKRFHPFKATVLFDERAATHHEIECCSPVSIPDTEEGKEEFWQGVSSYTGSILDGANENLSTSMKEETLLNVVVK